jgi:hypothetical protein
LRKPLPLCEVFQCANNAVLDSRCLGHQLTAAERDLRQALRDEARDLCRETHRPLAASLDIAEAMA